MQERIRFKAKFRKRKSRRLGGSVLTQSRREGEWRTSQTDRSITRPIREIFDSFVRALTSQRCFVYSQRLEKEVLNHGEVVGWNWEAILGYPLDPPRNVRYLHAKARQLSIHFNGSCNSREGMITNATSTLYTASSVLDMTSTISCIDLRLVPHSMLIISCLRFYCPVTLNTYSYSLFVHQMSPNQDTSRLESTLKRPAVPSSWHSLPSRWHSLLSNSSFQPPSSRYLTAGFSRPRS